MVINDHAYLSLSCFTNMNNTFYTSVLERQNGSERKLRHDQLPKRGGNYGNDYVIPLFVGYPDGK